MSGTRPEIDPSALQTAIDAIQKESDRTCAVLGGANAEAILTLLLRQAVVQDAPTGVLRDFRSKIDLAYAFGLISGEEWKDFHSVREIRNLFAHAFQHDLTFSSDPVQKWVRELLWVKSLESHPILAAGNDTPRFRFELTVGGLMTVIRDHRMARVVRPTSLGEIPRKH